LSASSAEENFELNAFRPILISDFLQPTLIMADMGTHFPGLMVEYT
jgi:hypothetical protein